MVGAIKAVLKSETSAAGTELVNDRYTLPIQ